MRSRGRYARKPRRDADSLAPVSSGRYRSVPLPRFRREVVALLIAGTRGGGHGPRLDSTTALRLVIKWDKMLRLRHSQGKPPCNVSDHILKFESQGVVCPCGSAFAGARDKERGSCRRCVSRGRGRSRRDPSRYERLKAWRDKKMVEKREDFAGMTRNVGAVTRAAAQGRTPRLDELESVRTPIGGFKLGRDPGKKARSHKTIYRKCPCGETAHELSGRRGEGELEYTCRNCYRVITSRPDFLKPLTREEWDRKERRRRG